MKCFPSSLRYVPVLAPYVQAVVDGKVWKDFPLEQYRKLATDPACHPALSKLTAIAKYWYLSR